MVSACGYDSVPWDLGAMLAVKRLRDRGVTGDNGLKYSHASAKKMSAAAPCTNHLVE